MDGFNALDLARRLQTEINQLGLGCGVSNEVKPVHVLSYEFVSDETLRGKVEKLFLDGHYARAVEEAYKYIDNLVKQRVGNTCKADSGTGLMQEAFSPKKPVLMLNGNATRTEQDEQLGYMQIFAGCMLGIRNPRAHDADAEDERESALKLLGMADHLVWRIKTAEIAQL